MGRRSTVYNDNITASWNKVSRQNRRLVKEFLQYCKSNDKSPQTIKQYEEWLKIFFCWNLDENEDKFFVDLKKRDFVNYFGYLRDLGHSPNRIATLKSVLSSLSLEIELLYEDLYPNFRNQLRGLEPVHITKVREKTVLENEEIDKILSSLVEQKEYQVACFLALLCSSGARKAEALQMKPEFFTESGEVFGGYMYLTPAVRSKGRGKVGKMIKKYIIKSMFKPFLDLWLEERNKLGITDEYLFVRKQSGNWVSANISTANSFAKKISTIFDIDYYNHASRHYFCTKLKRMNLPDDVIAQIFSWESSDMVKIYDDTPIEEKLGKYFDENGVKTIEAPEIKGEQ